MDEETRIKKDIVMFEENIKALQEKDESLLKDERVVLGSQYYEDAKYYLEQKDFFTAFGCINYGHGLVDAILKFD